MSRFASLTAGLLARKGEAEPASTPFADQLLTRVGGTGADLRNALANSGYSVVNRPAFGTAGAKATSGAAPSAFGSHGWPEKSDTAAFRFDKVVPPAVVQEEEVG